MSELMIKSNYHERPLLYYWELTDKQRQFVDKEHDYLDDDERQEMAYIIYRNWIYTLNDFMRVDKNSPFGDYWHGYDSQSYFSGVLIHLSDDSDFVVMGRYYC